VWRKRFLAEETDYIIIGSGIGGLLAGGLLSRDGWSVTVLEKLSFFGGKYTSISHNGTEIPTAAHHMLPHGAKGSIYGILSELGIQVRLIRCRPPITWMLGGRSYIFPVKINEYLRLRWTYPVLNKILTKRENAGFLLYLLLYKLGYRISDEPSVKDLLNLFTDNKSFHRAVDKAVQYSLGVRYDLTPAAELLRTFRMYDYTMECVVDGGLKSLISGIVRYLRDRNSTLRNNAAVSKIITESGRVRGVLLQSGETIMAKKGIISNAGIRHTYEILDDKGSIQKEFIEKMTRAIPAWGVNHLILTDKPMLNKSGVIIPVEAEYIAGMTEPTRESPSISKEKKSMVIAYQVLERSENIDMQLTKGREEFLRLCDNPDGEYMMSVFWNDYPCTEMAAIAGQVFDQRFRHDEAGIKGLWNIGIETVGRGIAAELIGHSVRLLIEKIKRDRG